MKALAKLIKISSEPFLPVPPNCLKFLTMEGIQRKLVHELIELLTEKNGFLAFESALHVFSTEPVPPIPGILDWNASEGWRRYYDFLSTPIIFFAQDIFACQFGITESGIERFDPETGEITIHSSSLEEWAMKILDDYNYETGWSLGKEWQERYGPLPLGYRLLGKIPFILGGDYTVENLKSVPLIEAMGKLGGLYNQIKDIPDGTPLTIQGW